MVGCQDKEAMAELEDFKAQAEVEEQNEMTIIRYFEEGDEYYSLPQEEMGDLSFLDKFFAPDYVLHTATYEIQGFEAFKEYFASGTHIWSDLKHAIEKNIADGDIVVSQGYFQATHKGEFFGIPASGKQVSSPVFYIHKFEDGKIKECWMDWDSLFGLTQQLGMELKPKEGEK
jgi:predicted ester cyclase